MCTPVNALVIESAWVSAKPILLHKICCYWGGRPQRDLKKTSKRPQHDLLALALSSALVLALALALALALSLALALALALSLA
jgi:hypothetical protein